MSTSLLALCGAWCLVLTAIDDPLVPRGEIPALEVTNAADSGSENPGSRSTDANDNSTVSLPSLSLPSLSLPNPSSTITIVSEGGGRGRQRTVRIIEIARTDPRGPQDSLADARIVERLVSAEARLYAARLAMVAAQRDYDIAATELEWARQQAEAAGQLLSLVSMSTRLQQFVNEARTAADRLNEQADALERILAQTDSGGRSTTGGSYRVSSSTPGYVIHIVMSSDDAGTVTACSVYGAAEDSLSCTPQTEVNEYISWLRSSAEEEERSAREAQAQLDALYDAEGGQLVTILRTLLSGLLASGDPSDAEFARSITEDGWVSLEEANALAGIIDRRVRIAYSNHAMAEMRLEQAVRNSLSAQELVGDLSSMSRGHRTNTSDAPSGSRTDDPASAGTSGGSGTVPDTTDDEAADGDPSTAQTIEGTIPPVDEAAASAESTIPDGTATPSMAGTGEPEDSAGSSEAGSVVLASPSQTQPAPADTSSPA
ncbi:hypothetical protein [uncultured Propionibacterium sp.]|uniref:hypothetical protein n=1 Tax=uncultured Propionibacterium sp. TaxID=218066 RepID=UPI00292FE012|nr:hypothetical protein [uncultured Propionibacterium sp.]